MKLNKISRKYTKGRPTTKEEIKALIKYYPLYESYTEIAEKVGRPEYWVGQYVRMLRSYGVDLPKKKYHSGQREMIRELVAEFKQNKHN